MSLVGYWPLSEDSGSTAYDRSGNGNDGTVNGATLNQTGILGTSSYSFDGTDDNVIIPHSTHIDLTSKFTISVWFKINDLSKNMTVYSKKESDSNDYKSNYKLTYNESDDVLRFLIGNSTGDGWTTIDYSSLSKGTWYHTVGLWDGSDIAFYINSKLLNKESFTGIPYSTTDNLYIGDDIEYNSNFNGNIADVRVYDRALTEHEITSLYAASQRGRYVSSTKTTQSLYDVVKTNVSLNGQTLTVHVKEDVDGDGKAENIDSFNLEDGENKYSVNNLSGNVGNSVWFVLESKNSSVVSTATFDSIKLTQEYGDTIYSTPAGVWKTNSDNVVITI